MLCLLSPAKSLDLETAKRPQSTSLPRFLERSQQLIQILQHKSAAEIAALMQISDKLARLNYDRYQQWSLAGHQQGGAPALLTFNGDVYQGLGAKTLTDDELEYANSSAVRILSGLYGLLRPNDLILPHRLEMGTRLPNEAAGTKTLYEFWQQEITAALNQDGEESGARYIVNLASQEYFGAVLPAELSLPVITPLFKDEKNGQYKVISFYAKKARGMMAAHLIKNRVRSLEELLVFSDGGYRYDPVGSTPAIPVFLRAERRGY